MNTTILVSMTEGAWAISCLLLIVCFVAYIVSERAGWIKDGKWIGDEKAGPRTPSRDNLDAFIYENKSDFMKRFSQAKFDKEDAAVFVLVRVMADFTRAELSEDSTDGVERDISIWFLSFYNRLKGRPFVGRGAVKWIADQMERQRDTMSLFFMCCAMFCFMILASEGEAQVEGAVKVFKTQYSRFREMDRVCS